MEADHGGPGTVNVQKVLLLANFIPALLTQVSIRWLSLILSTSSLSKNTLAEQIMALSLSHNAISTVSGFSLTLGFQ